MNGCAHCGGVRMHGRRVCAACYNAARRQRYASPRPLRRTAGMRAWQAHRPDEAWCWWCQQMHHRRFFDRNAAKPRGVQGCCKEGMRTLYRLRTLGKRRYPARGRRTARQEETP